MTILIITRHTFVSFSHSTNIDLKLWDVVLNLRTSSQDLRYFWNGEIEEATEILLLIKTKTSKVHVLSSYIRLVHPFEIPEVFSVPMDQGDVHYLKWLEEGMKED
ncbi:protein CutA homolog isoform X4 [Pteropus alecto]|uniref:protein CutA homolog isoform X4 n=1 Tax=Pteropus alecto TaxID=9402 RepID=UPI0007689A14|nr:protein CutA homolog isoform X4 [Pteropus alecto]